MTLLAALLCGGAGGFLSSLPLGPINTAVLVESAERGAGSGLRTGAGATISDLGWAWLAWMGVPLFVRASAAPWLRALGAALLIGLAIKGLRSWQRPNAPAAAGAASPGREFALGVALCATNPLFLGFWLSVISWCRDGGWLATGAPTAAAFLAGVAAGDAAWFALLSRLGAALGAGGGAAVLGRINGAAGLLFLGAAAWCVLDLWRESFG